MFRQQSSLLDRKPFSGRSASRAGDGLVPAEDPPSPPDTESLSSHLYAPPSRRPSHPDNFSLPTIPATPEVYESAGARFRRLAGIPTSQSGSREFRGASRPQTRWLIILMPPSNLITELSVGHRSPGRLSSGLLVPLFPTLFAQLAAIAKEFSLPSTTGLCLYLHLQDALEAPRITDDVWPLLWARHLHTDDASLPLGLPVAGRVQFDIDIPSARWYPMWFAHVSRKELVPDLARAIPASPRAEESTLGDSGRAHKVPRPLALAPRQERAIEVQIDSAPSPGPSPSKPTIPKSASKETVEKVRRWSELVTPDPAALRPDVPELPTDDSAPLPTDDTNALATDSTAVDDTEPEPLNLEDFQWSITSAGPPSPASSCATTASSRVPSIHLLERVEGSVLLTPTTATTWGPQYDSDIDSDPELDTEWRVRSPDIGERAEGSVLLTPSTATTWGAPLSYPPTPAQWHALRDHIVRTPDLGQRAEGSVLLTPSTATTWGPPLSYPPTPEIARPREWVPSPGLGDREELSPGRVGRMSTMQWGTEVETEEEAYARMGLPRRWEFGWPMASPLPGVHEEAEEGESGAGMGLPRRWEFGWPMASPLPGMHEGAEEGESGAGSVRAEPVRDEATATASVGTRSVSASVHNSAAIGIRVIQEDHYERDASFSGSEDDMLYNGAFGQDEEQEDIQGPEFQFELELESPQVVGVDEERSYRAVEESHGQAIAEAYGQEAEVSHGQATEMDGSYHEPFEYAPEDVSAGDASEEHASEASIEEGVFEYSFPDSATQPSFPVSVSASDDATTFPQLSPVVHPDSPFSGAPLTPRTLAAAPLLVAVSSVTASIVTTKPSVTSLPSPAQSYGPYPYLVIYPSIYPYLDLYPSAAARFQIRAAGPAIDANTQSIKSASSPVPSPTESVLTPVDLSSPAHSPGSVPSPTRSPSSSRKSSLNITVPTARPRSRSIIAVNPANKRSLEWSKTLPPVPPVPRELKNGSIGSPERVGRKHWGSSASLRSVREGSPESIQAVSAGSITSIQEAVTSANAIPHQLWNDYLHERRSSVVHDNAGLEYLPSKKPVPQSLSSAYPYRYPYNLGQLYPPKETLGYPVNLDRIYPLFAKAVRAEVEVKAPSPAALPVGRKTPRSEKSLAIYLTRTYPVFELYPAVYPHNLGEIYPPISPEPIVSSTSVPAPTPLALVHASTPVQLPPVPTPKARIVGVSRGYPFIELYPAVYPHNLGCLYPSVPKQVVSPKSAPVSVSMPALKQAGPTIPALNKVGAELPSSYPTLESSPLAYPFNLNNLYPDVVSGLSKPTPAALQMPKALMAPTSHQKSEGPIVKSSGVRLARAYPNFELYAPVYPFNLDIYPSMRAGNELESPRVAGSGVQGETVGSSRKSAESLGKVQKSVPSARKRETHAQLCAETWRKTHAQLVAEVLAEPVPVRPRKSHAELEAEVFPNGLSAAEIAHVSPRLTITPAQYGEQGPGVEPAPNPVPVQKPEYTAAPLVTPLRRQRSGTIMRPPPAGSLPPPPLPQGANLSRPRSMVEARTQMFERTAPSRSQTAGPQRPPRTLVRQKSASFERAKSLFHTPEENQAQPEGSKTPPRPTRRVSKLDMSKFGFTRT